MWRSEAEENAKTQRAQGDAERGRRVLNAEVWEGAEKRVR
jgi:hypothetical protein